MQVVIPMSGQGTRFLNAGYTDPKSLIEVRGKPIIAHLLENFPAEWPKLFICNEEHLANTRMRRVLESLAPGCRILAIPPHKNGPIWAILEAIRLEPGCILDGPCLINYCDFNWSWDPKRFEAFTIDTQCDGAVVCYTGFHPEYIRDGLYAYCRQENGLLLEIREKGNFTSDRTREYASSGTYFFKSGRVAEKYLRAVIDEGLLVQGEGFVSMAYALMLRDKHHLRIFEISYFMQWGTPEDLKDYEYWLKIFSDGSSREPVLTSGPEAPPLQLLMPMAGKGTRFSGDVPKPLIKVMDCPMFISALRSLPASSRQILVVRDEFSAQVAREAPFATIISITGVTEGQAISCELASPALDPDLPLLVSNCDHGLIWDKPAWRKILAEDPDVIVWGQRNYTNTETSPKAQTYLEIEPGSDRITEVFVKGPNGVSSRDDLILVGTFFFRRPHLMLSVIREMKEAGLRVNGEFYLDTVINLCIRRGWNVRAFESKGYLCWGTPLSLREYEYWHGYFNGLERKIGVSSS